jgi:hypothetical protein
LVAAGTSAGLGVSTSQADDRLDFRPYIAATSRPSSRSSDSAAIEGRQTGYQPAS